MTGKPAARGALPLQLRKRHTNTGGGHSNRRRSPSSDAGAGTALSGPSFISDIRPSYHRNVWGRGRRRRRRAWVLRRERDTPGCTRSVAIGHPSAAAPMGQFGGSGITPRSRRNSRTIASRSIAHFPGLLSLFLSTVPTAPLAESIDQSNPRNPQSTSHTHRDDHDHRPGLDCC